MSFFTGKIQQLPGGWMRRQPVCRDPQHDPPKHFLYPEYEYVHTCPSCQSKSTTFTDSPTW